MHLQKIRAKCERQKRNRIKAKDEKVRRRSDLMEQRLSHTNYSFLMNSAERDLATATPPKKINTVGPADNSATR